MWFFQNSKIWPRVREIKNFVIIKFDNKLNKEKKIKFVMRTNRVGNYRSSSTPVEKMFQTNFSYF